MFESALLNKLSSITGMSSYVSTFEGSRAIFSEIAPEKAKMPYLVFRILPSASEGLPVKEFTVFIDYFDYNVSRVKSRNCAEAIEFSLDRAILEHARFNCIRLFYFAGSPVIEEDPRAVHYNLQFTARGGRKKWLDETIT